MSVIDRATGEDSSDIEGQRRDARDSLFMLARIRREDRGEFASVRVRNVSSGGLMAQVGGGYDTGARVVVELEGLGSIGGVVAWEEAARIGIAFDHPIDKARARKPLTPREEPNLLHHNPNFRRPPLRSR